MHINGPSHLHGPHTLNGPHQLRNSSPAANHQATRAPDQVDISPAAEAAIQAAEIGDFRADLVARVRGEISSGVYETPDKLDAALDRFLDELG
ncbi:MAG: flagellar biosynthesis protein FlgM [Planctomycetota bacterium]